MSMIGKEGTAGRCPVCCGTKSERLRRVTAEEAARHYLSERKDAERFARLKKHLKELWQADGCDVLRCSGCGLSFASPFVAGDPMFYDLAYDHRSYPADRWEYHETIRALQASEVARSGKLLEIGAGDGAFLGMVSPAIFPKDRVFATEYSQPAVDEVRKAGFACELADLRELDLEPGSFSAVCMFQVLEHMGGYDQLFEDLNRLTGPKAMLFISVPNDARVDFNETHGGLLDMPPNHVSRWTHKAFEALAGNNGWRLAEHTVQGVGFGDLRWVADYRMMRRAQRPGSLSQKVRDIDSALIRKAGKAVLLGAELVSILPFAPKFLRGPFGDSQWARLERI